MDKGAGEEEVSVSGKSKSECPAVYKPGCSLAPPSGLQQAHQRTLRNATESRVSSVRSEKSHETRAHRAVGRELGRIAPCSKRLRIEVC